MSNEIDVNTMADILEGKIEAPQAAPVQAPEDNAQPPVAPPVTPPVETPPAQSTPPTDKPVEAPAAEPVINLDAELEKISGGAIKTKDEISALIEKANKLSEYENRLKQFEEENTSLKAKANTDPFANDYIKRLNDLTKAGANDSQIQAFTKLNKADLDGLSPIDARLLALQVKNGISEEEAKIYINSSYKLNPEEYDEATIAAENIRLKVDAQGDREFLKTHKAEVSTPPVNETERLQQEYQQKATEHVNKLAPIAKDVLNNVNFKGLSINGKQGDQNITADFDVSDDSKANLHKLVDNYVQNNWENIPANEEGKQLIENYAKNLLIIQNYQSWIAHAASVRETQVRAEYHNPTPVNRGQDAPNPGKASREAFNQALIDSY